MRLHNLETLYSEIKIQNVAANEFISALQYIRDLSCLPPFSKTRDFFFFFFFFFFRISNKNLQHKAMEIIVTIKFSKSHDSSVSIALGYGLDDRGSRF
jgi:hypothetical protein